MCQVYAAWALQPVRKQFPQLIIYHYMDDILIGGRNLPQDEILTQLQDILSHHGVIIAPEKVQKAAPWKYLRWHIDASNVRNFNGT